VYKFGHGLTYTSFSSSLVKAPHTIDSTTFGADLRLSPLSKQTAASFSVEVRNTGERDGSEVVLLFAAPPHAGENGRPLKSLVAFERVTLKRGESQTVTLPVEAHHFTTVDRAGVRHVGKGDVWKVWVGADGEGEAVSVSML
jgi:hypothetical protein